MQSIDDRSQEELLLEIEKLRKASDLLEMQFQERTAELEKANETLHIEIEERKQADEVLQIEKNKAQNYLDIAEVILIVIEQNENVSLINKKGSEILGYSEEEIIGKNWFDNFIPEMFREEIRSVNLDLMAGNLGQVEHFENPVLTREGKERLIAWHNSILRDENGNITSTLSSGEDITERRKAEEMLQKTHDELEMRVQERTAELAEANKALQAEIIERKNAQQELEETVKRLEIYTAHVNTLMVTILEQITDKQNVAILDISYVAEDVEIVEPLIQIARLSKLLGATCIVTGVKSKTVGKLSDLGVSFTSLVIG